MRSPGDRSLVGPLSPTLAAQVNLGGLGGARSGVSDQYGGAQDYVATVYWRVGPGGLFDRNRKALAEARVQIANLGLEGRRQEVERHLYDTQATS